MAVAFGAGRFVVVGQGEGNANVYRSSALHSPPVVEIITYAGVRILGVPGRNYSTWIDYDSPNLGKRIYRAVETP